jgi:hypothetical protein
MPAAYLKANKLKLAYQLKTWAIKILDVYRNEVYDTMFKEGKIKRGATNLVQLSLALAMSNAGADWIKNFILGKPFHLKDEVMDNFLRLFFLSKYQFSPSKIKSGGLEVGRDLAGGAVPLLSLLDNMANDAYYVGKWFTVGLDKNESLRYDVRMPSKIPFVGRAIFHGLYGHGGMLGREHVVNKEIRYYKELRKKRPLNTEESKNYGIYMSEKREIDAAKRDSSKGGYVKKWLGLGEKERSLGNM